jgi:hypothetical protein
MADPIPTQDESKKDTVRINLPVGVAGRPGTPVPPGPPTQKLKPEQEAKKETAVMGTPAPQPKRDTSRVQVAAAKPSTPETPRPTVRLRREAEAATGVPTMAPPAAAVTPVGAPVSAAVSGGEIGLTVGAMLLSIGVLVYVALTALG